MKTYMKPDMLVTEFTPNEAVAACDYVYTEEFPAQTVVCIVEGEETIFASGNNNCDAKITGGDLIWYDSPYESQGYASGYYYVWYTGTASAQPSDTEQKILGDLGITSMGYHAGLATSEIISSHNHS